MRKGLFVTFEGIDGCGKSTQLEMARSVLEREDFPVVATREPGGSAVSEKIRQLVMAADNDEIRDECEVLLYLAARAQHVHEKILPWLEDGNIVLCDRFADATFAYQGFGRGVSQELLREINGFATGGLVPARTFVFDISVECSFARLENMNKDPDRLERNPREFFEKIRAGYLAMAAAEPERIIVLAGDAPPGELAQTVYRYISDALRGIGR